MHAMAHLPVEATHTSHAAQLVVALDVAVHHQVHQPVEADQVGVVLEEIVCKLRNHSSGSNDKKGHDGDARADQQAPTGIV